jgi:hypothetical protein
VDGLPLEGYHAFHATRADLLRRLGQSEQSGAAYDRAIALAANTAETAYLMGRATSWPAREPHHPVTASVDCWPAGPPTTTRTHPLGRRAQPQPVGQPVQRRRRQSP